MNKSSMLVLWQRTSECLKTVTPQKLVPEASACLVDKKLGTLLIPVLNVVVLTFKPSVALARAVYARTKYVLLDDPLSAVVRTPP